MKYFIIKISVFLLILICIDRLFQFLLIVSPKAEYDKRLELVVSGEMNKDIIILGSSRAARSLIASQIEDSMRLSTYNLSYPGSDVDFHEFILRVLLKNNSSPSLLILTIDEPGYFFKGRDNISFRYDRLYPLTIYQPILDELILREEKNFLANYFILPRLSKSQLNLFDKELSEIDTIYKNGSMPIPSPNNDNILKFNNLLNKQYEIEREEIYKVNKFKNILSMCKSENIKLLLVFPPNLYSHNRQIENRFLELIQYPEQRVFVFDSTKYHSKVNYFYDEGHLNLTGAKHFTNDIIDNLKQSKFY